MDLGASGTLIHQFLGGPSMVFLSGADWKRHKKVNSMKTSLLEDCI